MEEKQNWLQWITERIGWEAIDKAMLTRKVPKVDWAFTLGSTTMFVAIIQIVTGMFLTMYYSPSPDHAYDSINYIMNDVTLGWLIRGLHHWGASIMVILVFLHMWRVFYYGAYKYPRELTWILGTFLLLTVLALGFTGYLLPFNQKAYFATRVGSSFAGIIPVIGPWLKRVLLGGDTIGALTLARFFSWHIWFLPAVLVVLMVAHIYLVFRIGISAPPVLAEEDEEEA